jgi:general secretion pathway protein D
VVPIPGTEPPGAQAPATKEVELIQRIVQVRPRTWECAGGAGTIDYHPLTMSLVVIQAPEVQEEVGRLLAALRREQEQEVVVEMRLLSVSEEVYQALAVLAGPAQGRHEAPFPDLLVLGGPDELKGLLGLVQRNAETSVLQAPRMTLFSGQRSVLKVTERQAYLTGIDAVRTPREETVLPHQEMLETGVTFAVRPVISADRRRVALDLDVRASSLDSESVPLVPVVSTITPRAPDGSGVEPVVFTQFIQRPAVTTLKAERKVYVPDGQVVLFEVGKRKREVRRTHTVPLLGQLPFVGELFQTVSYSPRAERVLCVVTSHIVVAEEEEKRPGPKAVGALPCSEVLPERAPTPEPFGAEKGSPSRGAGAPQVQLDVVLARVAPGKLRTWASVGPSPPVRLPCAACKRWRSGTWPSWWPSRGW